MGYIAIGREISCHTTTIATAIKIVSDTINVAFAISCLHIPLPPFGPRPLILPPFLTPILT